MIYVDDHCHWTTDKCHLVADAPKELSFIAQKLGLSPDRLQYEGTRDEHYDIDMNERACALTMGAIDMSNAGLRAMVKGRIYPQS